MPLPLPLPLPLALALALALARARALTPTLTRRAKPVGDPSTSATVRFGDFAELCGSLGERNCDYSLGKIA